MTTKWGVASAGKVCHDFVTVVQSIKEKGHEFVAVGARSLDSASEFAKKHNIATAYGSYEELAKDPNVEVVYVGTIQSTHFSVGKLMLENGKHVLLEKPMTLNLKQTKTLIEIARREKLFLMEGVWTRFFPAIQFVSELLEKGSIGDLVHVQINFGFNLHGSERMTKRELGGGTILEMGIYAINAVTMAYKGEKPLEIKAVGHLNEEGTDIAMSSSLSYSNNRTASITTSAKAQLSNELIITGTKGSIKVPMFWCPTSVKTSDETYEFPLPEITAAFNFINSSGFTFEANEVRECLKKGDLESTTMPLKDSETMVSVLDEIRRQVGVIYDDDE